MSDMISRAEAAKTIAALAKEFIDGGSPTAAKVLNLASDRIRALPAVEVGAKSGEIERAVWDAMGWVLRHAKQLPGDIIPTYTDGGNSDAETECRRAAARIRSALTATPAQDVVGAAIMVANAIDADMLAFNALAKGFEARPDMQGRHFFSKALRHYAAALARMKEATP